MPLSEFQAAPFYNESETLKYTTSSRIIEIESRIFERALELLARLNDGVPRLRIQDHARKVLDEMPILVASQTEVGLKVAATKKKILRKTLWS